MKMNRTIRNGLTIFFITAFISLFFAEVSDSMQNPQNGGMQYNENQFNVKDSVKSGKTAGSASMNGEFIVRNTTDSPEGGTVVASVGNRKIYFDEFKKRYTDYLVYSGIKDNYFTREAILNNMVNEVLLKYFEDNSRILNTEDYKNELEWTKKQAILAYLKDQEIYAKIEVTENELRKAFEHLNEKLAVRHLYAQTEEEANYLYAQVLSGVSFETLAKEVFSDTTLSKNGGSLGLMTFGDMDPAFEDAAYALKPGEVSPPVKTAYGYSIIKVDARYPHPLLTEWEYQKKKDHMSRMLKIKKKKTYEREYINSIFNRKKVSFDEKVLESVAGNLVTSQSGEFVVEKKKNRDPKVVQYAGRAYKQSEIEKRLWALPAYQKERIKSLPDLKTVIEGFLLQDRLYSIALKKGFDKNPYVTDTYNKLCDVILIKYKQDEIMENSYISPVSADSFYKENIHLFSSPDELNLQEILVARESLADSIKEMINKGGDFGHLARKYSIRKWSAENNGELGFTPTSRFGILKDKLWKLPVGELTGPIKIENFYGIFRVKEKRESRPIEFEKIKDEVVKATKSAQKSRIIADYLGKIRKRVPVVIYEKVLSSYNMPG